MKIIWKEFAEWPPSCGHKVEFYSPRMKGDISLFAFLEGNERYHGTPEEVTIFIRNADLFFDNGFLNDAKKLIKERF